MNQYQGAIGIFWENPKTKAKKYEFYDYFSKKIGVHSVKHISDDGFEIKDIKIAIGRNSISQLLNECLIFSDKKKNKKS